MWSNTSVKPTFRALSKGIGNILLGTNLGVNTISCEYRTGYSAARVLALNVKPHSGLVKLCH